MDTFLDTPQGKDDLPYEVVEDSKTFTVVTSGGRTLFPYFALTESRLNEDETELTIFTIDYLITIEGSQLLPLWEEWQDQNVREVSATGIEDQAQNCCVTNIAITPRDP